MISGIIISFKNKGNIRNFGFLPLKVVILSSVLKSTRRNLRKCLISSHLFVVGVCSINSHL